jgi:hypothetical protein
MKNNRLISHANQNKGRFVSTEEKFDQAEYELCDLKLHTFVILLS